MTSRPTGPLRRLAALIASKPEEISDHVHAEGDAYAIAHSWSIVRNSSRLGFGSRNYRDPRFDIQPPSLPTWSGTTANPIAERPVRQAQAT